MPHSLVNPRAQTLRAHRGATLPHPAARLPRRRRPGFPCPSAPQADVSWQILIKGLQAELGISCINSRLPGSPALAWPAGINLRRNQLHRSHWPRSHGAGHGCVPGAASLFSRTGLVTPFFSRPGSTHSPPVSSPGSPHPAFACSPISWCCPATKEKGCCKGALASVPPHPGGSLCYPELKSTP